MLNKSKEWFRDKIALEREESISAGGLEMTMSTGRAKFLCRSTTKISDGSGGFTWDYSFSAVYDPNPESENGKFWKYTPTGSVSHNCVKADLFEPGKEYYLDFTAAAAK
jgi:hypothetical protein